MKIIQGVVAVIEKSGKFLVGKRSLHKKSAPGFWCPITGKIEDGETEQAALVREVFEEAGLKVEADRKIAEFDTHDKSAHLHWWTVRILGAEQIVRNHEHSELRWVTIEEMRLLQPVFAEDLDVFEKIALHK
ncbi:MAG: NUDIX domain-containing protein [Bdellovibrionota bacterium]